MNIVLTDTQLAGLAYGTAKRNATNPNAAPMTDEQFAADLLGVRCDQLAAKKTDADKTALAADAELLALGQRVASSPKRDSAIAAAEAVLNS